MDNGAGFPAPDWKMRCLLDPYSFLRITRMRYMWGGGSRNDQRRNSWRKWLTADAAGPWLPLSSNRVMDTLSLSFCLSLTHFVLHVSPYRHTGICTMITSMRNMKGRERLREYSSSSLPISLLSGCSSLQSVSHWCMKSYLDVSSFFPSLYPLYG